MSPQLAEEEIASLVEETSGTRTNPSKSSTPGSFRSCWLLAVAVVAALFVAAFLTDTIEIKMNMGASDTKDKADMGGSTVAKSESPKSSSAKPKSASKSKDPPPLVHSPPVQEPGYKSNPAALSDTYLPRGKPINATDKQALSKKYGTWTLVDPKADQRPNYDFYARYPNRDIPREQFPKNAWQIDTEYLAKFLPEAKALIERGMEAMLAEYGHSPEEEPGKTFEERAEMFSVTIVDLKVGGGSKVQNAGWMTARSFQGLVRRVLHAVMTEDTFTLVMGGHSAAAAHGNIFQQSYTLQVQRVLEPIFARLGVKHTAHNMGMGGLGTVHNGLAAGDLYGKDIDILVWDSGMTEKDDRPQDLLMRQGLMGGDRIPIISGVSGTVLKYLDEHADADVATLGSATAGHVGIPNTVDEIQAESLPFAARYIKCSDAKICRKHKYDGQCWIDRPDFTPAKKQGTPGGRVSWHPGNKAHQLYGRAQSFPILKALHEAITVWAEAPSYALPDDAWHVTKYYDNIRSKALSLNSTLGKCHKYSDTLPSRVCDIPMQGRSEYLPRRNPDATSIRSILKYPEQIEKPAKNAYDPPDIRLPFLDEPYGAVDYLNIVENGVDFVPNKARIQTASEARRMTSQKNSDRALANPAIVPGLGWSLNTHSAPQLCDGSYNSFCGKERMEGCLLYGGNDHRGGIFFDSFSGWLIVNLADFKHGLLILRLESWHAAGAVKRTGGWTCENNACNSPKNRRLESTPNSTVVATRHLKKTSAPPFCDDYKFEFIIDGKKNSWNNTQTLSHKKGPHFFTLLDDPDFIKGKPKDVEFAMRSTGCGRNKTLQLSHIYWA